MLLNCINPQLKVYFARSAKYWAKFKAAQEKDQQWAQACFLTRG